jgi:hypothetical protein
MSEPENPENGPAKRTQETAQQGLAAMDPAALPSEYYGTCCPQQASAYGHSGCGCKGSANCASFRVTRWGRLRSVRLEPGSSTGRSLPQDFASSPARLGTRDDLLSRRGLERTCEVLFAWAREA